MIQKQRRAAPAASETNDQLEIQDSSVNPVLEEEAPGIGYEIVIGSEHSE